MAVQTDAAPPAVACGVLDRPLADTDPEVAAAITVNRNAVPFAPRPPMVGSGVRIGTPALAARGFGVDDFAEVADVVATALRPSADGEVLAGLRARVTRPAGRHPLRPDLTEVP
ncbi:hypothetical protein ACI8AA_04785 [Geodermatophilus sp. SYSU D01180]